ncbi:MAG TPA: sulfite exporter TauE/SafE family protein [Blastocatellia bacterium]|nr:sulfite exporter TauE/SafE family protein [Blastocatellia bacterium]
MGMHLILGLLLSAAIGLSLGLMGGGGSIITLPVLVYVIGVDAHQAVGMSLAVVGAASLIGAALHHRRGTVNVKTGALFGLSGTVGAYFGSRLTYLFSAGALLLSFAALMLVIALLMLTGQRGVKSETAFGHHIRFKAVLAGLVVGLLTGFLGVGGGFLIVPALVLFGGLAMKDAIGTSLMVIAINCAAGLAAHLSYGGFDLRVTALVTALAAAGTLAGTALSHRTAPQNLRRGFAVFVIAVAAFLIAENYSTLF